jgi:AcrR family transcriptional regulator
LYAAFGDKRALYLKALETYVERGRRSIQAALAGEGSAADAPRRVYEGALSLYLPPEGEARGCFLIGTAATEALSDSDVRRVLGQGLAEFDRMFEARLRHARSAGELAAQADPASLAKMARWLQPYCTRWRFGLGPAIRVLRSRRSPKPRWSSSAEAQENLSESPAARKRRQARTC